jgi:hypothetical protein
VPEVPKDSWSWLPRFSRRGSSSLHEPVAATDDPWNDGASDISRHAPLPDAIGGDGTATAKSTWNTLSTFDLWKGEEPDFTRSGKPPQYARNGDDPDYEPSKKERGRIPLPFLSSDSESGTSKPEVPEPEFLRLEAPKAELPGQDSSGMESPNPRHSFKGKEPAHSSNGDDSSPLLAPLTKIDGTDDFTPLPDYYSRPKPISKAESLSSDDRALNTALRNSRLLKKHGESSKSQENLVPTKDNDWFISQGNQDREANDEPSKLQENQALRKEVRFDSRDPTELARPFDVEHHDATQREAAMAEGEALILAGVPPNVYRPLPLELQLKRPLDPSAVYIQQSKTLPGPAVSGRVFPPGRVLTPLEERVKHVDTILAQRVPTPHPDASLYGKYPPAFKHNTSLTSRRSSSAHQKGLCCFH